MFQKLDRDPEMFVDVMISKSNHKELSILRRIEEYLFDDDLDRDQLQARKDNLEATSMEFIKQLGESK